MPETVPTPPAPDKRALKAKKKRRKRWVLLLCLGLVLALAIAGVFYLRSRVTARFAGTEESTVTSAAVTTGSISTTVSGSGTLADEDVEEVSFPASIELDEVYVSAGDTVAEGDALARVSQASVLAAMSDLQAELDDYDDELADAASDAVSSSISAGVAGRVKAVYVSAGDDVAAVMEEHGALMLLSLDGKLAADLQTDAAPAVGGTVAVTLSDGTVRTGAVAAVSGGTVTVTVSDNGVPLGDQVTVAAEDGTALGTGTLYIHKELRITGFAGTVSGVSVRENSAVGAGTRLITLTDTAYTANYDTILSQRADAEAELLTLIGLYRSGVVTAPAAGVVASVDYDPDAAASSDAVSASPAASVSSAAAASDTDDTLLLTIAPHKTMALAISVDESEILSLAEGQEATVSIDSIADETFTGTVTGIDTTATSSGGVTRYTVTISLDRTDKMLSGMSASAAIRIESVDGALLVPTDALVTTSAAAYVYTTYDEAAGELGGMTEVTTGLSNGTYTVVTSGLSEGDTVWYDSAASDSSAGSGGMAMGGNMPSGDFSGGGNMPSGDFSGGGNMPSGGSMPSGGGMPSSGG